MSNLTGVVMGYNAVAQVTAASGTPSFGVQRGFAAALVDNGTGDTTLTLQNGVNLATEAICLAGLSGSGSGMVAVEAVSTTSLRIRAFSGANAAADRDFWIAILPLGPQ